MYKEQLQQLENNLQKTSEEVLGFEAEVSKRDWFDANCKIAIGKSNEVQKSQLGRSTTARCTHYKQLRREGNKICI